MPSNRLRHALAAPEPGGKELVGVSPVGGRTRRAAGLPPGAASLEQHSVRLPLRVVPPPDLASRPVGLLNPSGQADRVVAVAALRNQLHPAVITGPGPA